MTIATLPESVHDGDANLWERVLGALARIGSGTTLTHWLPLIPLFGAVLLVALWTAMIARLDSEREATLEAGMSTTNSIAVAFSENTLRELRDIDRTARLIKVQFERDGHVNLPFLTRNKLVPVDQAIRISVIDGAGNVVAGDRNFASAADASDRALIRRYKATDSDVLEISQPMTSPRSGRTEIQMSRRLNLGDGSFGGIVVLALAPADLTTFYDPTQLGQHGMIAVLGLDGAYRVRRSGDRIDTALGSSATPLLTAATTNGTGAYVGESVIDHTRRLVAYRKLVDYPLIVAVGQAEDEVLAKFRRRQVLYLVTGLVASLVIIVFFATTTVLAYHARHSTTEARRQKALLRAVVDNMPLGLIVRKLKALDRGRIVIWNPAAETIFDVPAVQAMGKPVGEVLSPDFAAGVKLRDDALLENPSVQEFPLVKADLQHIGQRALRIVRAPIFDQAKQIEYVVEIVQDVTGEQAAADTLRLYAKVFETTADAIVISDADDRVVAMNAAFTKLTGFEPEDMLGKPVAESPFRPSDPGAYAARQQQLMDEGSVTTEVLRYRKDGSPLPCWLTKTFVRDDTGAIVTYLRVFTDISKLKDAQSKLMWLANLDVLTGLPTRRIFDDRLERALRRAERAGGSVGLLYVDLDHFKTINDMHGHDAGDTVLREVSRRMKQCVRASDSLCRLGGDEFTVVMEDATLPGAAHEVAERIIWALDPPVDVGGNAVACRASIGIAIYPDHGRDAETLLKRADMAMYQAKHAGRERCVMATAEASVPVIGEKSA